ncbi:MAG: hypothetical protein ACLQIK_07300 [Mycobacterium sp.]|uniref:hypothetical protein n=1 Tax=Mycobacterium sp. TaxID=1785 RepID=UPI003F9473FD
MTPEELAGRLTEMFRGQTETASDGQRASVRRWQGTDRFYRQVQRAAAQVVDVPDEAHDVMEDLIALAQPLRDEVVVWRGVRSVDETFGVAAKHLVDLVGAARAAAQFFATSADRGIVEGEFTGPATSPALLRVQARRGAHAVWVPPLGNEENAGQMELLFLPTAQVRILGLDRSGEMPIVFVEVSDG